MTPTTTSNHRGPHTIPGGSARWDAAPLQVERPDTPQGTPGLSVDEVNPEPCQGLTGSEPRRPQTPMENQTAEAGRCCAHRTGSAPALPTVLGGR